MAGDPAFSNLLFDTDSCFNYASSLTNPPKMLCFSDYAYSTKDSDSSSDSSTNNTINSSDTLLPKSKKKRNGVVNEAVVGAGSPSGKQGNGKRSKSEKRSVVGHAKGKKEGIGERISTLQQLVSPFGKSDTATVLDEAIGYIRFLQDQVQVLCSPYLQPLHHEGKGKDGDGDEKSETGSDLKSKGLCLVPVGSIVEVVNTNGADFWSPAMKTSAQCI